MDERITYGCTAIGNDGGKRLSVFMKWCQINEGKHKELCREFG